jgi:hypothetical protein
MLQIVLLLPTCGPPRHGCAVNAPLTRAVISFTVLVVLCYTRVVTAGTTPYECPFQKSTDISETMRRPEIVGESVPPCIISLIYASWRTFSGSSFRHSTASTTSCDPCCPGRFHCLACFPVFIVPPRRWDTKSSSYFSESTEVSGTQSGYYSKGSEGSGAQHCPQPPPKGFAVSPSYFETVRDYDYECVYGAWEPFGNRT